MYLMVVFVIVIIWCWISFLKWKKNMYDPVKQLPSFGYPIVGWLYKLVLVPNNKLFKTMNDVNLKCGPVFRTWIGLTPLLIIFKPEWIETIINNTVHIEKGFVYDSFRSWLGRNNMLYSTGAKWQQQRKLITPTFHFKILENFVEVFIEKAEILLKNLDAKGQGKSFDICPEINLCSLDIFCETAMGIKINAMTNENHDYIKAIHGISESICWRMIRPYVTDFTYKFFPESRKAKKLIRYLHNFTRQVINDRKNILKSKPKEKINENVTDEEVMGTKKRSSFLDSLLEDSDGRKFFTDDDMREQVDGMLFAGYDTTSTSICWTLFLLGNHGEVQRKAYEEVHNILGERKTPSSISELNDFKYLECVIKESLRMYPSAPFIMRKLKAETEIDGCKVPAGIDVLIPIYDLHNSPEYYPNPEEFLPERFFPENVAKRHPYAYIPFSAGPRNCIGQKFAMLEEKTILASIINRYKITAVESQKDIAIILDIILRSESGIILTLQKRI